MSPIYDWECRKCHSILYDTWAEIEEKEKSCAVCNGEMFRHIGAPMINMGPVPTGGYYDETLNAHVETKTQWKRLCEEQGVTPKGDTPKVEG